MLLVVFYPDRLLVRSYISDMVNELFEDAEYRASLYELVERDVKLLKSAINFLFNDANHLLESALVDLAKVHEIQVRNNVCFDGGDTPVIFLACISTV